MKKVKRRRYIEKIHVVSDRVPNKVSVFACSFKGMR